MYTPSHFHSDDIKAMHAAIRRHPFGLLITLFQGELNLTHLPFHLDATRGPHGTLEAHLARLNPHCAALQAGAASTVVFKGPDAYVSPRWYLDPAKNVPTWNYVAIHAHGVPKPLSDPTALLKLIGTLTDEHEAYIEQPWSIREAEPYAERLTGHIMGFELEIEKLEGKFKLSQNRLPEDRVGVLRELAKSKDSGIMEMLELMRGLYREDGSAR